VGAPVAGGRGDGGEVSAAEQTLGFARREVSGLPAVRERVAGRFPDIEEYFLAMADYNCRQVQRLRDADS
jgi:hypothetical protein